MIVSILQVPDEPKRTGLFLILEPGNLEKIKAGEPILKHLREFLPELPIELDLIVGYSPDVRWVAEEITRGPDRTARALLRIVAESLARPEVLVRGPAAEELKKDPL